MIKYLSVVLLSLLLNSPSQGDHDAFPRGFSFFPKYEINGTDKNYKFKSNLIEDKAVIKQIKNYEKTGLISYLLFENGEIVIDEKSSNFMEFPEATVNGKRLLKSNSVGKSLSSYVIGHAICEGYVDSVDTIMNDWPIIKNTLYEGQKLIDVLNMSAGDQEFVGQFKYKRDDVVKGNSSPSSNILALKYLMENNLQNTKKSKPIYNYSALATHVALNYIIFKTGKDYQKLLNKIFNEHVKVENSVYFLKNSSDETIGSGRYTFYATRYDYLRIAKTIMDDWNNDTCVGKYLKNIYEGRIKKKQKNYNYDSIFMSAQKYGGQFHFDLKGLEKRKILGMDGLGGQQIVIDFDKKKIIVINSLYSHYNWKKIVHKKLKQK
jgi:hypothetical protein